MSSKLRWGILGCAGIATGAVMPGIQLSERGVITAIASRDLVKSQAVAERFGVQAAYGSYEELLADDNVDAVYIPLPNHLHCEWTVRAAEAGKHVLCEKPIALNAEEAERMVQACRKAGVLLAEAFMYRHTSQLAQIRDIAQSGEIGELRVIRSSFSFNNSADSNNIRYRKEWGGGSVYDVGCYPLTAARFITGQQPLAVTAHAFLSPAHNHVDMMASGLVEFEQGMSLLFDCGMWAYDRQGLDILGTEGKIEVPSPFLSKEPFNVTVRGERRAVTSDDANAYALQADQFAKAVAGEEPQLFEPEDAVINMRIIDACMTSIHEKRRVEL